MAKITIVFDTDNKEDKIMLNDLFKFDPSTPEGKAQQEMENEVRIDLFEPHLNPNKDKHFRHTLTGIDKVGPNYVVRTEEGGPNFDGFTFNCKDHGAGERVKKNMLEEWINENGGFPIKVKIHAQQYYRSEKFPEEWQWCSIVKLP